MCARFKYRTDLWLGYLRFCLQISSKKNFYRAFSNAIRYNSGSLPLWLAGIYFESETNLNPFKGRQLFMRAIKMNSTSQEFWTEYFRYECLFVKIIENREDVLTGQLEKKEEKESGIDGLEDDGGFLAFHDEDAANPDTKDLLQSSDEEDEIDEQEKIDLEKKRSNHTLLLVIFDSIKDNFKDKPNVNIYKKLLTILRNEKGSSEELKLALQKVSALMQDEEELEEDEKLSLLLVSKGIIELSEQIDEKSSEEKNEKLSKKLSKFLNSERAQEGGLEFLLALNNSPKALTNWIKDNISIKKLISYNISKGIGNTKEPLSRKQLSMMYELDLPMNDKIKAHLHKYRANPGYITLYMAKHLTSEADRLKYLEDISKVMPTDSDKKLSKVVVETVIEFLTTKKLKKEAGDYKYIAQYLKGLIKITKLNVEVVNHLCTSLIEKWLELNKKDTQLVNTCGDMFWHLKKQCPARMFAFLLENSTTVPFVDLVLPPNALRGCSPVPSDKYRALGPQIPAVQAVE